MKIERERFVLLKKSRHGTQILCTVSNQPRWCYVLRLENELIRSYSSEAKAKQAFKRHFGAWNPKRHRLVRVIETYQSVSLASKLLKEHRARAEQETNITDDIFIPETETGNN